MKHLTKHSLLLFAILTLFACKKEPGFGGNSAITGMLVQKVYNEDFTEILEEIELSDSYVYLATPNHNGYLERVRTAYNGTFEFNNLNPGDYIVYAYSKDTTRASLNDVVISTNVTIKKINESLSVGSLQVATNRTVGNSTIGGRVMKQSQTNPNVQYPAQDERVFIIYNNDLAYKTYTRTTFDGYYLFDRLPVGRYKIYAYSLDINNISLTATIPVIDSLQITQNGTDSTLSDIVIY